MARSLIREDQAEDAEFVSPEEHEGLHNRDSYIELIREHNKVVIINEWRDITKTFMISSTAIERSSGKVSKIVKTIYNYDDGTSIIATITGTINRYGNNVSDIEFIRDVDMEGI
jgi:hypothetical protein